MSEPPALPDTAFENRSGAQRETGSAVLPPSMLTGPVELREPPGEAESTLTQPARPDQAPSGTAGRNLLYGEIARGGMGAVLKGRDPLLGRDLAVKVLLEAHRDKPELVGRFVEEAQIGGQLQHPGVVPVYELGNFDDRPFFTMKLVKGQTLATLLLERGSAQADLPRFLTIFEQVCQTVAYAHARGVIHRDLKPANIMVGAFGEVQVMDWGMAKVLASSAAVGEKTPAPEDGATVIRTARSGSGSDASQAGTVLGTPAFMPPEQANGEVEQIDERADVFGLGAILCAVLTGKPPYADRGKEEVFRKARRGDLTEAFTRLDGCRADAELTRLCRDCLAPERDDRPRDAGVVAQRVAAYQAGVQERLRRAELERAAAEVKAAEERKRRKLLAGLVAAALALVVVGAGSALWLQRKEADRREAQARRDTELRQGVETDLQTAAALREQPRWTTARQVLARTRERLGETGPADLWERLGQATADLELAARLDDLRQKRFIIVEGKFDTATALREYPAAFAEAGLGRMGDDEEAVAARVRNSAVRPQLVAALDDWASITPWGDDWLFRWLLGVARRADPDPSWRDRFREPAVRRDLAALERLTQEANVEQMSPQVVTALGQALLFAGADPVPLLRDAQRLHPDDFWLTCTLGAAYLSKKPEEAEGHFRAALALQPNSVLARNDLGNALAAQGKREEAVQEYHEAIRLDPKFAYSHYNLGVVLKVQGKVDEAIREHLEALRLNPEFALAHNGLGNALAAQGKREEAVQEFREAIRLDPNQALIHYNLGAVLREQGKLDEAVQEYREAIRLDPKFAWAHNNLGNALADKGELAEAVQAYREAIRLDPKLSSAQNNLRDVERLVVVDRRLAAVLEGNQKPADAAECLALARLCQMPFNKLYASSVRFYADAFAADSKLAADLRQPHRYNAACAATLAGCGQGKDADKLEEKERARLRQQAAEWLRADLALWSKIADNANPKAREAVQQQMKHWQNDSDLAGVRDKDALAKLPEAERDEWRMLWDDVAELLKKAQAMR